MYKRKSVIAEAINEGSRIEGLTGYVPCESKCCCGSHEFYVPVVVTGIKLGNCEVAIIVKHQLKDVWVLDESFHVSPKSFYSSISEIIEHQQYLKVCSEYHAEVEVFDRREGYSRQQRNKVAELLDSVTHPLVHVIQAEMTAEAQETNVTPLKLPITYIKSIGRKLVHLKHFPDTPLDTNPTEEEDE